MHLTHRSCDSPFQLLEQEPPEQVQRIWTEHHASSTQLVASTLPAASFSRFCATARAHPLFVLPVPKGTQGGFVSFLLQCQLPYVICTLLEEYQRRGAAAQPHLVVSHYDELVDKKGIVLVRGELVTSTNLDVGEAARLVGHMHAFYTEPEGQAVVADFNRGAASFDFSAVLNKCGVQPHA